MENVWNLKCLKYTLFIWDERMLDSFWNVLVMQFIEDIVLCFCLWAGNFEALDKRNNLCSSPYRYHHMLFLKSWWNKLFGERVTNENKKKFHDVWLLRIVSAQITNKTGTFWTKTNKTEAINNTRKEQHILLHLQNSIIVTRMVGYCPKTSDKQMDWLRFCLTNKHSESSWTTKLNIKNTYHNGSWG